MSHLALGLRIEHLDKSRSGVLSYVAFGPPRGRTPDCFLRTTDTSGNWHYRWSGLPENCEIAVQKHIIGGENTTKGDNANRHGNEWVDGRLRPVTFGYDGWVVYRGEQYD
jgi:hypothetical protein